MPQPDKCYEFMRCDGLRRETCPAFKKGNALSCWAHAGSFCPDLEKEFGRKYVKVRECRGCAYWQYRHPGGEENPAGTVSVAGVVEPARGANAAGRGSTKKKKVSVRKKK